MIQEMVMDEARAFMMSRVILTAAELDLFTCIDEKPCTASSLAQERNLDVRATTRILDCLSVMKLLAKADDSYQVTDKGVFLSSRHPETILPMVLHMAHLWKAWGGLTDIVRTGPGSENESGLKFSEQDWKAFVGAMHVAARALSKEIADIYDLSRFTCLLDVGAASGTYTIAFLRRNPRLKAIIFDLEDVVPMAQERVKDEGLSERVEFVTGDFYEDELPAGCDLALLSAIIHQNSPEENLSLYGKIFRALDKGGTILIRDHIMNEDRTKPPAGAIFAINMLVNTHGGDTYTFREVKDGLESAGFLDVKLLRIGEKMDGLVEARKP
jgi:SAM-dependent methyltransferase/predicted transcriptional regulator